MWLEELEVKQLGAKYEHTLKLARTVMEAVEGKELLIRIAKELRNQGDRSATVWEQINWESLRFDENGELKHQLVMRWVRQDDPDIPAVFDTKGVSLLSSHFGTLEVEFSGLIGDMRLLRLKPGQEWLKNAELGTTRAERPKIGQFLEHPGLLEEWIRYAMGHAELSHDPRSKHWGIEEPPFRYFERVAEFIEDLPLFSDRRKII